VTRFDATSAAEQTARVAGPDEYDAGEHDDDEYEIDPKRVRIGLGLVVVTIVIAVGLFVTVTESFARFIFAAIIVIGLIQTFRLFRALKCGTLN
jgi:hypothetical protein